ncbi:BatD family protein [Lacinutrix salivirga]
MKNKEIKNTNFIIKQTRHFVLFVFLILFSKVSFAQDISTTVDSTSIKIGSQITYQIQVETDTTNLVIFPEGQTFLPLEMIESYKIDTTKKDAKYKLIKKYGLTQFDSGSYTIPKQKIIIGGRVLASDSINVEVQNIVVDTTKQGLYDIKPIIKVNKSYSNRFWLILGMLTALAVMAFVLYWFIWRKKPLTEEQQIALLPPYDRAKLALQKLDESNYLENEALKDYYSELTFIIRKYLDEKVYDRALESTTDELITRLNLLSEGNLIDINKDDINKIESILKRADLVKFAKSAPDVELAKLDRKTIDLEIDQVKQALPEPTEEEKLLDKNYKEEQERKKKSRKVKLTIAAVALLLLTTYSGFGLKYGFKHVNDTLIGHQTKQLLEKDWYTSSYGYPPMIISTPEILKRTEIKLDKKFEALSKMHGDSLNATRFLYNTEKTGLSIQLDQKVAPLSLKFKDLNPEEFSLSAIDSLGFKNVIVQKEKFVTPNEAEGLKIYGTASDPNNNRKVQYTTLFFSTDFEKGLVYNYGGTVVQTLTIIWDDDDTYSNEIVNKVLDSVELVEKLPGVTKPNKGK